MRSLAIAGALVLIWGCGRGGLADMLADGSGAASGSGANGSGANGSNGSGLNGSVGPTSGVTGQGGAGTGTASGGSSGTMNGAGGSGPVTCPPFMDACTICASANCPEIWCGCVNNQDCLLLFQCFADCMGDPMCEQTCLATHQNGISAAALVSGCAGTTCNGDCMWGNPTFDPCQECIYTDCAAEMNACLAMPDCGALYQCLTTCGPLDLTCQQQCYLDYPGGVQTLETALMCIANQCQNECS